MGAEVVIHVMRAGYIRGSARRASRDIGRKGRAGMMAVRVVLVVLRAVGRGGAVLVEIRCVLGQYMFEMAPVEDQYSVEQLSA